MSLQRSILLSVMFFSFTSLFSQTTYFQTTTTSAGSTTNVVHNAEFKIGLTSVSTDRTRCVLKFGDGSNVQIGEWEQDNMLSFQASKVNFTSVNGLNVSNSSVSSMMGLSDGSLNVPGRPRLVFHQRWDIPHAYVYFNQNLYFVADGSTATPLILQHDGSVGIGFPQGYTSGVNHTNGYKLSVNGNIRAKSIDVETGWSDFVFEDGYKLMSLVELEEYIKANKHLPQIPTAKEVEANGINLGTSQQLLLQKVEELTLYIIELNKLNEQLIERIEILENESAK